jgi:23S rRNA pseudouridine2605 synthase
VTLNGVKATLGESAVTGLDVIAVDGIEVETTVRPLRYFALNKPSGVVSTTEDPQGRTTVLELLDPELVRETRPFPVGRLDMDSTGLILLTNDGFLANRLLHPRYEVSREYLVEVEPVPGKEALARLRKGLDLEDGHTGPARVSLVGRSGVRGQVRMTMHTGKKRQIRRSFEALGHTVLTLNRVRFASLGLGSLKPGQYRELHAGEVRALYHQTGFGK